MTNRDADINGTSFEISVCLCLRVRGKRGTEIGGQKGRGDNLETVRMNRGGEEERLTEGCCDGKASAAEGLSKTGEGVDVDL